MEEEEKKISIMQKLVAERGRNEPSPRQVKFAEAILDCLKRMREKRLRYS